MLANFSNFNFGMPTSTRDVVALDGLSTNYEPQVTLRNVGSKYALATRKISVRMILKYRLLTENDIC